MKGLNPTPGIGWVDSLQSLAELAPSVKEALENLSGDTDKGLYKYYVDLDVGGRPKFYNLLL